MFNKSVYIMNETHVTYFLRIKIGRLWMSHKTEGLSPEHKCV